MLAFDSRPTIHFPRRARKLSEYDYVCGGRVGRYRILYSVAETALVVVALKVGHRMDIYR